MSTVDAACPSACSRASVDLGWFRRRQLITIGGVALAVASQFELPITFIGLGEKMEDLRPFDPHDFARALLGREEA